GEATVRFPQGIRARGGLRGVLGMRGKVPAGSSRARVDESHQARVWLIGEHKDSLGVTPMLVRVRERFRRQDRDTIVQKVAAAYRRARASRSVTGDVRRAGSTAFAGASRS